MNRLLDYLMAQLKEEWIMWTHWENIAHLAQNLVIDKVNTKFIICFTYWLMTVVNSESSYNPGNLVQKELEKGLLK